MDRNVWFSRRAFKLHAVILIVVPAFMALCVWQITRAVGGNSLSWAYVFEWPLFAAYAVYMWWRLLHEDTSEAAPAVASDGAAGRNGSTAPVPGPSRPGDAARDDQGHSDREDEEDAELAAYNEYLAQLADQDKAAGR